MGNRIGVASYLFFVWINLGFGGCVKSKAVVQPPQIKTEQKRKKPAKRVVSLEYVQHRVDKIIGSLSQIRGIKATQQFQTKMVDRKKMRVIVQNKLKESMPEELLQLHLRIMARIGILPNDSDPKKMLLDFYSKEAAGLYDQKTNTMFINESIPFSLIDHVLGHELAHGLQDCHLDLDQFMLSLFSNPNRGFNDAQNARGFLLEGDAETSMLSFLSPSGKVQEVNQKELFQHTITALQVTKAQVPYPVLIRIVSLPYTEGARTVARYASEKGWEAVNKLYTNPPTTTEQMLHYDKLLSREQPLGFVIKTKTLLQALPGEKIRYEDGLGEASLLGMLAEHEDVFLAQKQAAGWNGDRFLVLEKEGRRLPLIIGKIAWDTEEDAKEFEPGFRAYLTKQKAPFLLARKKNEIVYGIGVDKKELIPLIFRSFVTSPLENPTK